MGNNNTFTDKHLASLAAIMLLAPAVALMLKEKNINISSEEEGYVRSFIRYGYWILTLLFIWLLVWWAYTLFFSISILYRINYGLLSAVIAMIIIGLVSVINNKQLLGQTAVSESRPTDASVLLYFIPLYNYYLWYNEELDKSNYWRVKESVLLWSIYLIIISIRPTNGIILSGFLIIMIRAVMLATGMDILSLSAKNSINKWFYHNIEEFIAYPLGVIAHSIKKIFQRKSFLINEIDSRKRTYAELLPMANWRSIVSYLLAGAAIGYRGYTTRLASDPSVGMSLALLPQILWIGKIAMTIPSGKLPKIPLLYSLLGGKKTVAPTQPQA